MKGGGGDKIEAREKGEAIWKDRKGTGVVKEAQMETQVQRRQTQTFPASCAFFLRRSKILWSVMPCRQNSSSSAAGRSTAHVIHEPKSKSQEKHRPKRCYDAAVWGGGGGYCPARTTSVHQQQHCLTLAYTSHVLLTSPSRICDGAQGRGLGKRKRQRVERSCSVSITGCHQGEEGQKEGAG